MAKIKLITTDRISICFTDVTYGALALHVIGGKVTIPDEFLAHRQEIRQNVNGVLVFAPGIKVSRKIQDEDDHLCITLTRKAKTKKEIFIPARFVTEIEKVSSTAFLRYC